MTDIQRHLVTRSGIIPFPAYIPVTTFGQKYPLDELIRPYLPRLSNALMISHYYARKMEKRPTLPIMIDSGGFASLFKNAKVLSKNGLGIIELQTAEGKEFINPLEVLEFQERVADIAFTLDFPIPPGMEIRQAKRRQKLTINNAIWALENRRRRDLPLYACVQAWDETSAKNCAQVYNDLPFEGIAIGGLVPRARDHKLILRIVEIVREKIGARPLHVFGLGNPNLVEDLFQRGVDSVDSSSYVKYASQGKLWCNPKFQAKSLSPTDRLHIALCNLATATGRALPISTSDMVFSTHSIDGHHQTQLGSSSS